MVSRVEHGKTCKNACQFAVIFHATLLLGGTNISSLLMPIGTARGTLIRSVAFAKYFQRRLTLYSRLQD